MPTRLVLTLTGSRIGVPFPPVTEAAIMWIIVEVLREAANRMPQQLSNTIGTVGAVIIGTAIVKAGLVDPVVIIGTTFTALGLFTVPTWEMSSPWRWIFWLLVLGSYFFGVYGIVLVTFVVVGHLASLNVMGVPYLAPFGPVSPVGLQDSLVRFPTRLSCAAKVAARRPLMRWGLKTLMVALTLMIVLTGCWNNMPVEHRDLVMVIGIEPAPHHEVRVLFQIPSKAGLVQLPGAAGAGGGATGSGSDFYTIDGVGKTFSDALDAAQDQSDRNIYLTQTQALIFSNKLSGGQFMKLLDTILRIGAIDKDIWVISSPTVAKDLKFAPREEVHVPGLYFTTVFNCYTCTVASIRARLWDVYEDEYSGGRNIAVPYLTLGPTNFIMDRLAIYKDGRVATVLSPRQSLYAAWLMGIRTRGTIETKSPYGQVSIRDVSVHTRYRFFWNQGHPHEVITVNADGQLSQLSGEHENLFTNFPAVRHLIDQKAEHEMASTMELLQKKDLDPIGLLLPFAWRNPGVFPTRKILMRTYQTMPITIRAHIHVSNLGGKT